MPGITVLYLAPITCTACGTHFEDTNPEQK
jgi:hypothetical protein